MSTPTLTPAERIKRSAQRADCKRRQMASIGMMKCDCTNRCQMLEKAGDLLSIVIGPAGKQAWSTEAEVDRAYYGWLNLRESKP